VMHSGLPQEWHVYSACRRGCDSHLPIALVVSSVSDTEVMLPTTAVDMAGRRP
jgi:hypothetical protein